MQWCFNGLSTELYKEKYKDTNGLDINGDYLSLEYLREKLIILLGLKRSIESDMVND